MLSFTPILHRVLGVAFTLLIIAILFSCKKNTTGYVDIPLEINSVEIAKWFNDYHAVYTPTLDDGRPADYEFMNNWLLERGMFIDYEIVSATYDIAPDRVEYMRNFLIPNGFGIFGHGHAHDNHDQFDYQGAYNSFKTNFDRIKSYGFTPIAYAYPYGAGKKLVQLRH